MNDDYLMNPADEVLPDVLQNTAPQTDSAATVLTDTPVADSAAPAATDDLAREREMHAATEARYKSLQGQYDSFRRERSEFDKTRDETTRLQESHQLMQAQLEDMRALVAGNQQTAQLEEPIFDETLKGFLGDQSSGFEQALTRAATRAAAVVQANADKQIAALTAQLNEVQRKSQAVPFDVLRNSDNVYDTPAFAQFIEDEKDAIFGMSIKEQMTQMHAQGKDVIPALKRARDLYLSKKAPAAEQQEQPVNPRITPAGAAAVKPQSTKADPRALQAEYQRLVAANLAKDRPRRIEIQRTLARLGVS